MSACYGRVSEPDQLGVQCTLVCATIIHVNGIYTSVQAEVRHSITGLQVSLFYICSR